MTTTKRAWLFREACKMVIQSSRADDYAKALAQRGLAIDADIDRLAPYLFLSVRQFPAMARCVKRVVVHRVI